MTRIILPDEVAYIINTLEAHGHEAYAVGGCVRDGLLGKQPEDWDICTPALPEETMRVFGECRAIETGLRHGTITLMLDNKPFEITTYRVDGTYTDHRRPDSVTFVRDLKEDLSRRDFTINAMAYHPAKGIVDFWDGAGDLKAGLIRCVGEADQRFREDALRVMRAMRFASVLGFAIAGDTAAAMLRNQPLLREIAAERFANEFNRLLLGDGAGAVLGAYIGVITEVIPELAPTIGFEHNNPHHCYDVLTHILTSLDYAPKYLAVRLAMLLHDIAKPACYSEREGKGHFYGHQQASADMARQILQRLKYDRNTLETVVLLIQHHDVIIPPDERVIRRWLNLLGEENAGLLLQVKRADAMARAPRSRDQRLKELEEAQAALTHVLAQGQCFSYKTLAVNGKDLMALGLPEGRKVGAVLRRLLEKVINGDVENDRAALLELARAEAPQGNRPDAGV